MIYLDNAATTKVRPEVVEAIGRLSYPIMLISSGTLTLSLWHSLMAPIASKSLPHIMAVAPFSKREGT